MRHNEVRDLLGNIMRDVCHNVTIEPQLTSLSGVAFRSSAANTACDARLDFKANGFWNASRYECAYFDVRIFHPHVQSYHSMNVERVYRTHERSKRSEYEEAER